MSEERARETAALRRRLDTLDREAARQARFLFFPHEFRSLLCLKMQFGHR